MRSWVLGLFLAVLLIGINTSCRQFEVVSNPGDAYVSRYNLPSQRIVPYTNPNLLYTDPEALDVCELVETEKGLECI